MDTAKLFSLEGKVALVTGGSRGIGRMIVEGFLGQGAKVYITGRNADVCAQTVKELGPNCIALPQDVSTIAGCEALVAAYRACETSLDILVNNIATVWHAAFEETTEAGWDKVMDVNVKSLFFLTQKLHETLKRAASPEQPAKVINIGSIDGFRLNPWDTISYQVSKAAVVQLTKRVAARLVRDNIHMMAIAPGPFGTEKNRISRDRAEEVGRNIPAGRVGRAEDMAGAAIYLASRAGDYVVGETIAVDGGLAHAEFAVSLDRGIDYDHAAR